MTEDRSPAERARAREDRNKIAIGVVTAAGVLPGLLVSGWFGSPISMPIGMTIAAIGGVGAGFAAGGSIDDRIVYGSASVVAAVATVFAVGWYVEGRTSLFSAELLLPLAIGAAIGFVVWLALRTIPPRPIRLGAAFAIPALLLVIIGVRRSPAEGAAPPSSETTLGASGPKIEIIGRGPLRDRLGPKAEELFRKVDLLDSMIDIYGVKVLEGSAGQKAAAEVRRVAGEIRKDVDRRIAAGEPAANFDDFADIERRIDAVIGSPPDGP